MKRDMKLIRLSLLEVEREEAGAAGFIGPSSRITRLMMPRAGPPLNRLVSAVCAHCLVRK